MLGFIIWEIGEDYDEKVLFVFGLIFFFTPQATAQNKVVVIPLMGDEASECITCKGKLVGNRWCDQANGTVMDMTTGLAWLKKADWAGVKPWRNPSADCSGPNYECYDDAHTRVGILRAGSIGANLSDGSVVGDWRLPTITELSNLANGTEAIRANNMRAFTGVTRSGFKPHLRPAGGVIRKAQNAHISLNMLRFFAFRMPCHRT